jgi:hypothetical protein
MPTSVLVGRDGQVLFQHIGFNDRSKDDLEAVRHFIRREARKQNLTPQG